MANSDTWSTTHDIDALIMVEVLLVTPEVVNGERLQIANIQFNNLDIIGKLCRTEMHPAHFSQLNFAKFEFQPIKRQSSNLWDSRNVFFPNVI